MDANDRIGCILEGFLTKTTMKPQTIEISKLIAELTALQGKGCSTVEVIGTVYCPCAGNTIIISTEPQH